jgi:hypothetical protein
MFNVLFPKRIKKIKRNITTKNRYIPVPETRVTFAGQERNKTTVINMRTYHETILVNSK